MTSKLKCPFCQQELHQDYTGVMYCCNNDCEQSADWYGSVILWKALIQTKQDLKTATKALENIVSDYEVDASNGWLAANAKKTLEQIGQKDNK